MLFDAFLPNLEISWPIHICKLQRSFCTTQKFDQDFTNQITSNRFRNQDKNSDEITKLENQLKSILTKSSTTKILFWNSCTILVVNMNRSTHFKLRILFKFNSRRNNWRKKTCVKIIYWWRISSEMDKQLRKLAQIGSMTFDLCSWGH